MDIERIFHWIKEHKLLFILIIILSFILLIFLIQIPFWIGSIIPQNSIKTDFNPSDLLVFLGSYLAFLGTFFLGFLALLQNQRFKDESNKKDRHLLFIENEKLRLQYMPSFLMQDSKVEEWSIGTNEKEGKIFYLMSKHVSYVFRIDEKDFGWIDNSIIPCVPENRISEVIELINCGNNTAHQVKVIMQVGEQRQYCYKSFSIAKDDKIFLFISYNRKQSINERLLLILRYFDTFQNVYEQEFEVDEENINGINTVVVNSCTYIKLDKRSEQMQIIG